MPLQFKLLLLYQNSDQSLQSFQCTYHSFAPRPLQHAGLNPTITYFMPIMNMEDYEQQHWQLSLKLWAIILDKALVLSSNPITVFMVSSFSHFFNTTIPSFLPSLQTSNTSSPILTLSWLFCFLFHQGC